MRIAQEKVECFHDKMNYPIGETPQLIPVELAEQRRDFIAEETQEYLEAVQAGDLTGIADAIGDILYVVLGTAVVHGIDIQPIFEEIHRSNMTKDRLDPVTKKGGKGPGYEKPQLESILLAQVCHNAEVAL